MLKAMLRFYKESRSCVRVGNDVSDWFPVNVAYEMLVREVNVRVLGKWLDLLSANGGSFQIKQRLYANDTALVADLEEKLCRLVSEFGRVCKKKKVERKCR